MRAGASRLLCAAAFGIVGAVAPGPARADNVTICAPLKSAWALAVASGDRTRAAATRQRISAAAGVCPTLWNSVRNTKLPEAAKTPKVERPKPVEGATKTPDVTTPVVGKSPARRKSNIKRDESSVPQTAKSTQPEARFDPNTDSGQPGVLVVNNECDVKIDLYLFYYDKSEWSPVVNYELPVGRQYLGVGSSGDKLSIYDDRLYVWWSEETENGRSYRGAEPDTADGFKSLVQKDVSGTAENFGLVIVQLKDGERVMNLTCPNG